MRVVLGDAFLRAVLVIAPLVNFALTGAVFALTVVLRQSGFDAGLVGGANAVFAVGGLVGAMLAPRLIARLKIAPLIRLAILVTVASVGVEAILAGTLFMAVPWSSRHCSRLRSMLRCSQGSGWRSQPSFKDGCSAL